MKIINWLLLQYWRRLSASRKEETIRDAAEMKAQKEGIPLFEAEYHIREALTKKGWL